MSHPTIKSWEEALKRELKTDQVERFLSRQLAEGVSVPLLAHDEEPWQVASGVHRPALSFTWVNAEQKFSERIPELAKLGVWDFVIDPFLANQSEDELLKNISQIASQDVRLWMMTNTPQALPSICSRVICASDVIKSGGHSVHEMAWVLDEIIKWAQSSTNSKIGVALQMDSEFFKSIAKVRAMKAITMAALTEFKKEHLLTSITWIGRCAWRDFSAFDAASNILRNAMSLSAGYVAGLDVVESLPYDLLIQSDPATKGRAARLALTSQLVLKEEAHLGEVHDAASGSFTLENLTKSLGEESWALMQELQGCEDKMTILLPKIHQHWQSVQKKVATRKFVQAGVNDFPEPTERIILKSHFLHTDHVRLGQAFELLRLEMQNLLTKPAVIIPVVGDYAALNARLSFTKNFFELLGLQVIDSGKGLRLEEVDAWLKKNSAPIMAVVASDDHHPSLRIKIPENIRCYLAGKTKLEGMINLYAGMDVEASLRELLLWWRK